LQKTLAESVFHYAKDRKKAAGRALGTLVEVVAFYLLKTWRLERFIGIERRLPEYSNEDITHNVEYSLHPAWSVADLVFPGNDLPLSVSKLARGLSAQGIHVPASRQKTHQLLSSDLLLRNACTIAEEGEFFLVAAVAAFSRQEIAVAVSRLFRRPFAIVECKRVGIEEGTRKGPQTIEKAKQGAYVARSVSSLQKIRLPSGEISGVFVSSAGKLVYKGYEDFVREIISSAEPELLRRFVLTVGVVSNHGNWFTSDDHNKELKVLAQSYDWLLFLTDQGLAEFIKDLILHPSSKCRPVRDAFLASYGRGSGANRFTKVRIALEADQLLQAYFVANLAKVETWFNVIGPRRKTLRLLRNQLHHLAEKNWEEIHK
jgi:hypothetical protein